MSISYCSFKGTLFFNWSINNKKHFSNNIFFRHVDKKQTFLWYQWKLCCLLFNEVATLLRYNNNTSIFWHVAFSGCTSLLFLFPLLARWNQTLKVFYATLEDILFLFLNAEILEDQLYHQFLIIPSWFRNFMYFNDGDGVNLYYQKHMKITHIDPFARFMFTLSFKSTLHDSYRFSRKSTY